MMANYANLQAAIDAGITNMTAKRNNSKNDDNTDTIATGITWFYFNSVQVTNLYVSGNSWIGFGASSEHLKVNRRDAAVWYEYTETGTIGTYKFLKLRWVGYSAYSATSDANLQQYDVFLLDNGQIYLNWFDVPTSYFDGTRALVCGSVTTTFAATSGTACEYTFTPTDAAIGTGWSVASGRPNLVVDHKTSGSAIFTATGITGTMAASSIGWTESKPDGTTLTVSVSTDGTNYSSVTNGGALLMAGTVLDNATIYIKVEMATTDATVTPTLSNLSISLQSAEDRYSIVLEMQPLERFESAAGNITVAYAGGSLMGEGGPVAAFTQSFSPSDLAYKGDQNDAEHIEMSVTATGTLTRIYYIDMAPQDMGHIEISSITATGTLTNVNDL